MKNRRIALRAVTLAAGFLTLGGACASKHEASSPSSTTTAVTSTTDPDQTPNSIPFNVGERVGLPNGWIVRIGRVHRPYAPDGLPALPAGRQYVAVDVSIKNDGTTTRTVNAAKLFWLGDSIGKVDHVVAVPNAPNGVDGTYAPQTKRSGRLVFDAPVKAELRMGMDGTLIGTQNAIFMVDPPNAGPSD
jgi:hypothetical protein